MKKNYFWSPHIDPQVATLKSVLNSIKSLAKYEKNFKTVLINVFGEWNNYNFDIENKINLIINRGIINRKFKGFFNSRFIYRSIFFLSYFPLKKILKKNKPNHLVVHLITSIPILLFIFNKFETELILRISGYPKLNLFRFLLWKIASRKIKYVICPTKETRDLLLKKNIFKNHQLILIPDPVISANRINILKREKLFYKPSKPFFLSIGRFTRQKNHIFLLKFFSKNPHYLKNYQLIFIGEGELENTYKKIIRDGNLDNKIEILGYEKNIFNYIYNAECVISSSLWEDPGFVMVEAAFLGTPIISSNCSSGPKEFIGNNENGFIYNLNDQKSFQKELDNFLNISKEELFKKIKKAKRKSRSFTGYYNYKKLSKLLN